MGYDRGVSKVHYHAIFQWSMKKTFLRSFKLAMQISDTNLIWQTMSNINLSGQGTFKFMAKKKKEISDFPFANEFQPLFLACDQKSEDFE